MVKYIGGGLFISVLVASYLFFGLEKPQPEYQRLLGRIMWEHFRWTYETYELTPYCMGGDLPGGIIKVVAASQRGSFQVATEEARRIFLACVLDLLRRINSDRELRPYLMDYPFTSENVEYSLSFDDLKHGGVLAPHISHMQTFGGIIVYSMWDEQLHKVEEVNREGFEEALKKAEVGL